VALLSELAPPHAESTENILSRRGLWRILVGIRHRTEDFATISAAAAHARLFKPTDVNLAPLCVKKTFAKP